MLNVKLSEHSCNAFSVVCSEPGGYLYKQYYHYVTWSFEAQRTL